MNGSRRCFALSALGVLFGAASRAQSSGKVHRVAIPLVGPLPGYVENLKRTLGSLGYVEGKNIVFNARDAEGKVERLPSVVAELIAWRPDVICVNGTPAALAAKQGTSTIPIVISFLGDPVSAGLVNSLSAPGGNVTGVSNLTTELSGKHVQLLHELLPRAQRFAVLMNGNPSHPGMLEYAERAARRLGISTVRVRADTVEQLPSAFEGAHAARAQAMVVLTGLESFGMRKQIAEQALRARLPSIYAFPQHVQLGGLISYGHSASAEFALLSTYVDKILKGASPAQLPIQQASSFELAVNVTTAKALGITIPDEIMLRADHVYE